MASTELSFADEAAAKQAFTDVRSNDTATNWLLFTYSEKQKNTLELVATGSGGVDELKTYLSESKMCYGLVRVQDIIDQSVTIKFVFIIWCGEKVPFVQKGKMTTHKGSVTTLMGQFHNDINASSLEELSEEIIMGKVTDASGSAVHWKDSSAQTNTPVAVPKSAAQAPTPANTPVTTAPSPSTSSFRGAGSGVSSTRAGVANKTPGVPQPASVVQFVDEENIRNVIKKVRADNDDTDWFLIGYEGNTNKIVLVGHGSDGLDELIAKLKDDQIYYGLYRTTDTVDNTVAVKFVFIIWIGDNVPMIRKARIATHKGDITNFVGQYHVDCTCSNFSEINDDIIRNLVQRASGTAVHVK